jgi:DNA-binding transcriptional LysR family regulator
MEDLKQLWIFNRVARLRSFTRAADELTLTRSRVSQAVKELEDHWGVRLIIRTTRTVVLTPAGERLLEISTGVLDQIEQAKTEILEQGEVARGTLKIASPVDVGDVCLSAIVAAFRKQHPDVSVDLVLEDAVVNLAAEGIDLSVRVGWLKDSTMQAVRIAPMEPVVCAAPHLIKSFPKVPKDLLSYSWVALNLLDAPLRWTFEKKGSRTRISASGQVTCNSPVAMRSLVLAGAGIGVCPDYQVAKDLIEGRLVRLLPDYHLRIGGIYAVHHYGRNPPLRVRLFLEFLKNSWPILN